MLLTRKNPLKPSGFCANRVTRLGCNFYENYSFGSSFLFFYYSKLDYLVITNKLKTIKDSKLLFWVYFSIFIIYLDVAIYLLHYEFEICFSF
jgi:hypothetical protein